MKPTLLKDRMVTCDDLIITNKLDRSNTDCSAPQGRLFQVLGRKNGRRIVREIDHNTVVVGGAITALENVAGVEATWRPSTLNSIYNVDATPAGKPQLALFGIGVGGSNLDFGSVIAPDIKQRDIISPIPMRYSAALTGDDASKYFMKVPNAGGLTNSWYLKQFTSTPVIKSCWKNAISADEDGTEILTDIYNSENTEGIETFAEIQINLNTLDGREYYEATGTMASARFNTIGFYTGSLNAEGTEYGDVRLYSVITMNNRDLSIASKSEFIYRLYSLI